MAESGFTVADEFWLFANLVRVNKLNIQDFMNFISRDNGSDRCWAYSCGADKFGPNKLQHSENRT